ADSNPMHRSPHYRSLAVSYDGNAQPIVYLGAFTGLFASNQDAKRWTELESIPIKRIIDTAVSPTLNDDFEIALTTYGGGAYLLRDSKQQWRVMNRGLRNPRLTGVAFSPMYAHDGKIFTASPGNMLIWNQQNKSWDRSSLRPGGLAAFKRWVLGKLRYHLKLPASITTDLLTATERNPPFPDAVLPSATYSDDARVFVSSRRHGLLAVDIEDDNVDIVMPSKSLVKDIVLSPNFARDQTMFATVQAEGVFRSTDAGSSWQSVNNGLEALEIWQQEISEQGRQQEATQKEYFTARMAMGASESGSGVLFLASGAGLFRSDDLGESWRHLNVPVRDGRDFAIAVATSPDFASDGTVIVSIKGQGLFLSEDGGELFVAFAPPLAASSRTISQIQFSPRYAIDASLYASSEEVLYNSRDAGTSWLVVARPVRYEDSRDVIRFSGDWQRAQGELMSGGSEMCSAIRGSRAAFRFVGSGVRWLGDAKPDLGAVKITLDGATLPADALKRGELNDGTRAYAIDKLEYGAHELVIELAEAAHGQVTVDALDVLGAQ
ncbi:MAG: WD40/YVTN/BNR-like repeat-containing protein, partial [Pseudomonadales bacterium]